jgi:hypothetical protein
MADRCAVDLAAKAPVRSASGSESRPGTFRLKGWKELFASAFLMELFKSC